MGVLRDPQQLDSQWITFLLDLNRLGSLVGLAWPTTLPWPTTSPPGGSQWPRIYERSVVKDGGADSVSRVSRTSPSPSASVDLAHLRPSPRTSWSCNPQYILRARGRGSAFTLPWPAVFEVEADVT